VLDTHSPEAWAEAIERLIGDSELRAELGEAAWRTVAARWTLDHSIHATVAGLRLGALVRGPD